MINLRNTAKKKRIKSRFFFVLLFDIVVDVRVIDFMNNSSEKEGLPLIVRHRFFYDFIPVAFFLSSSKFRWNLLVCACLSC